MNRDNKDDKREIKELFNKIAPFFGKVGPKYWDKFGNKLVELSNIGEGAKVLDVGVGRGASLLPTAKRVGKRGRVIGIDFSETMVQETHKEILNRNIDNAEVLVMDIDKLEFIDEYFDNIVGGFIFNYFVFSENKFDEVLRVLKKDGQASFSIWGVQEDQKWLHKLIEKYLPVDKKHTEKNQEVKTLDLSTAEGIEEILSNSGFSNINIYHENNQVIYKDKNEWWQEMWSNAARGVFEKIESLGINEIQEFKEEAFNGLENFRCEAGFCFRMPVIYAIGTKQSTTERVY